MSSRYRLTIELSSNVDLKDDAAQGPPGERRVQINMRGILAAFAWIAIWGAGWSWSEWFTSSPQTKVRVSAFCLLLTVPPAAALGAIARQPWFGLACGIASGVSFGLWIVLND